MVIFLLSEDNYAHMGCFEPTNTNDLYVKFLRKIKKKKKKKKKKIFFWGQKKYFFQKSGVTRGIKFFFFFRFLLRAYRPTNVGSPLLYTSQKLPHFWDQLLGCQKSTQKGVFFCGPGYS